MLGLIMLAAIPLGLCQLISFKYREHLISNYLKSKGMVSNSLSPSVLNKPDIKLLRRLYVRRSLIPLFYSIVTISILSSLVKTSVNRSENEDFFLYLALSTILTMFISINLSLSALTVTSKSRIASEIVVFIVTLLWTILYSFYGFFIGISFLHMKFG